jgi:enoyl-CoA hydratase/carnithine racemase
MYASGMRGDYAYGRRFWRDEYRMNAKLFEFPKPVVSFLQGFTMGGGVGVGCHGSHRIVGDTSQIAMPEVGIGLIPDVGGSLILSRAPGFVGAYLGTTGARLQTADAIFAGFADYYVPEDQWDDIKQALVNQGDVGAIDHAAKAPPASPLKALKPDIDLHFAGATFGDILRSLNTSNNGFAQETLRKLQRNAPLSMACTIELLHRLTKASDIRHALTLEYRFTHRAMEHADFLEGIRAAIIDKDRTPVWRHDLHDVPPLTVRDMLHPLGTDELSFERTPK